jgi:hypothetical protein
MINSLSYDKWFGANELVLNLDKTNITKFVTINLPCSALHTGYKENYREETANITFLGLQTDNHLNCKNHIELMIPELSGACYADWSMVHIVTLPP